MAFGMPGGFRQSFNVTYAAKDWFFDREKVIDLIEKKKHRSMRTMGAYIRRTARGSIKSRSAKKHWRRMAKLRKRYEAGKFQGPMENDVRRSAPGQPPFSWQSQEPNIKTILYRYDSATDSVVIGPVKLVGSKTHPPVPHTLEYGGTTEIEEYRFPGTAKWIRGRPPHRRSSYWKNRRPAESRRRSSHVAARPFMHPALRKEAPKFPELFSR